MECVPACDECAVAIRTAVASLRSVADRITSEAARADDASPAPGMMRFNLPAIGSLWAEKDGNRMHVCSVHVSDVIGGGLIYWRRGRHEEIHSTPLTIWADKATYVPEDSEARS
jgi:hypothetical protein